MKKLLSIVIVTLMMVPACTANDSDEADRNADGRPEQVISEFRGNEGFKVIRLGYLGTGIARTVAKAAFFADGDEEAMAFLNCLNGIRRVSFVGYEDCDGPVADSFNAKMKDALKGGELILQVKDDGSDVSVYGTNRDGYYIFLPDDGAVVYIKGKIDTDRLIEKIVEEM